MSYDWRSATGLTMPHGTCVSKLCARRTPTLMSLVHGFGLARRSPRATRLTAMRASSERGAGCCPIGCPGDPSLRTPESAEHRACGLPRWNNSILSRLVSPRPVVGRSGTFWDLTSTSSRPPSSKLATRRSLLSKRTSHRARSGRSSLEFLPAAATYPTTNWSNARMLATYRGL